MKKKRKVVITFREVSRLEDLPIMKNLPGDRLPAFSSHMEEYPVWFMEYKKINT